MAKVRIREFGLKTGTFKRWNFEAYTISWIPHDFLENPHLCVFDGVGARIFPKWNKCPLSVGKNFNLEDTLKIAANAKVAVANLQPVREGVCLSRLNGTSLSDL
jgi:hypothetical protein